MATSTDYPFGAATLEFGILVLSAGCLTVVLQYLGSPISNIINGTFIVEKGPHAADRIKLRR